MQENFAETIGPQILSEFTQFITKFHLRGKLQAVEVDSGPERESDASKRVQNALQGATRSPEQRGGQHIGSPHKPNSHQEGRDAAIGSKHTYAHVVKKPKETTKGPTPTVESLSKLVLQPTQAPTSLQNKEKHPKLIKVVL